MKSFPSAISIILLSLTLFGCTQNLQTNSNQNTQNPMNVEVEYDKPKDWNSQNIDGITFYSPEESDVTVALVEVGIADSPEDAAKSAFRSFDPKFNREIKSVTKIPADKGWTKRVRVEFATTAAENRMSYAYVHELNGIYFVPIVDGSMATISKRQIEAFRILETLTVKGFNDENFAKREAKKLTQQDIQTMLSFIKNASEQLKVPAVGVAIVQGDRILYQGGTGIKGISNPQPIDKDTLFMVGSNSKSMTTLLLAKLVEIGKLDWEDRVVDHYPKFKLGNKATTESVKIKHLICACTGLPRNDFNWIFKNNPSTQVSLLFDEISAMEPNSKFGEIYQYSNQMGAAAGYVAGHVAFPDMELGAAYDKAMQTYVFNPLKMSATTISMETALSGNHALPHSVEKDGSITEIHQTESMGFNHTVSALRPSGGVWSSPHDMAKFVLNELNAGINIDGERVFDEEPLLARRKPFVSTGPKKHYGMALSVDRETGVEVIYHGGATFGYLSDFYVIPDADAAIIILTNSSHGYAVYSSASRRFLEILYDGKPKAQEQIELTVERNTKSRQKFIEEYASTDKSEILSELATEYHSDKLGTVRITKMGGQTFLETSTWKTLLGAKSNEDGTRSIIFLSPVLSGLEFIINNDSPDNKKRLMFSQWEEQYVLVASD